VGEKPRKTDQTAPRADPGKWRLSACKPRQKSAFPLILRAAYATGIQVCGLNVTYWTTTPWGLAGSLTPKGCLAHSPFKPCPFWAAVEHETSCLMEEYLEKATSLHQRDRPWRCSCTRRGPGMGR